jgi:uncharacterized protein (TIGR03067 family)
MKLKSLQIIIVLAVACTPSKKSHLSSYDLNGVWIPTKQEMNGKDLPQTVYNNYKLTMIDSTYIFGIAQEDKGITTYGKGKMDIYGKEGINKGKHFMAIYKLENGMLTICYNLTGDSYPQAFETKSKPTLFITVYKRG